jgi:hypothetical protein
LFGAKKDKLKQRYFFNVSPQTNEREIWLSAWPRYQRDAANFRQVELILDRQKFLPSAILIYLPAGESRTLYVFDLKQAKVNDLLEKFWGSFQSPRTPRGWKKREEQAPAEEPPQQAARPRPNLPGPPPPRR